MSILSNCSPERVFYYFEQIAAIPHGSGNMGAISAFCENFAAAHNLRCCRDAYNNVIIYKPAAAGREEAPTIILQGHLDMVCEKTPGSDFHFETDGLRLQVDGDWLSADGTTLGADNGIAIAMILAILESDTLAHPALEAVFTTDEETSLAGATGLDVSRLQGKYLMNLDSEDEGVLTVSCAGGVRVTGTLPVMRQSGDWMSLELEICGLRGGHSGMQINEGRGSSNQLMGRLLCHLQRVAPFCIDRLTGGNKDNVIAAATRATLAVNENALPGLLRAAGELEATLRRELSVTDPGVTIAAAAGPLAPMHPLTEESTRRLVGALVNCPQGVIVMSPDLPGLVQTSLNIGVVKLGEGEFTATFALRSSCESQKTMLIERLDNLFGIMGGKTTAQGDYPGWAYARDSRLREHAIQTWKALYGVEPKVEAIHAGLECGLFADKIPGLDAISLGPTMVEVHSPEERLSISSTKRTFDFICRALETWGQEGAIQ